MAGRPIIKAAYKALSGLGEPIIFEKYLEVRSVGRLLKNIEPDIGHISVVVF